MQLALLADTHDDVAATLAALQVLEPHKPDVYLHAGDLVSPEMLIHFADLPFHFVFGNNEYDRAAIRARARALNLLCHEHLAQLSFAGKRLALLHGDDMTMMRKIQTAAPHFDYIVTGHTHVRRDHRLGRTRHVNPGAIHRTRAPSVALLHVESDSLQFLEVPRTK